MQFSPRLDYPLADLRRHRGVLFLKDWTRLRRFDRIEYADAKLGKSPESLAARPSFVEPLDSDRNHWAACVDCQDCRALAERFGNCVDAALSFGEEHQHTPVAQPVRTRAHGGHEVRVGVDGNQPDLLADSLRSEERRVVKECRYRCDWSSDVCSSDLPAHARGAARTHPRAWRARG